MCFQEKVGKDRRSRRRGIVRPDEPELNPFEA